MYAWLYHGCFACVVSLMSLNAVLYAIYYDALGHVLLQIANIVSSEAKGSNWLLF